MTSYFLGVDVGGTKSHALIADENGRVLGLGEAGPGNPEMVGYEGLAAVLQHITAEALHGAGVSPAQITGAGFGIAGYDWPADRRPTLEAIRTLGLDAPLEAVNDALLGLLAGSAEGWGVVVEAGTSCNCRGRDRERREGRVTGDSWNMGEGAGASELVRKAVQAVALAWTRRGDPTALTQAFMNYVGAGDVVDLLEGIVRGRYPVNATLAPLVFQVAAGGDAVATNIITWAGRELGNLAVGVIRQLDLQALRFDVILAGSFFNGSSMLLETVRTTILAEAPGARVIQLAAPPVIGGVLLGMEQAGYPLRAAREHLANTTAAHFADFSTVRGSRLPRLAE
jgi:N-acetylglucosamine kinase-like BadF-type ATPase